MAYDDSDQEFERTSHLYEDDMYADTFGERLNGDTAYDPDLDEDNRMADDDDMLVDDTLADDRGQLEDGFGETISPQSNPHIEDQLNDSDLNREAEADYTEDSSSNKDESLIDKAKNKIDEITHKDK